MIFVVLWKLQVIWVLNCSCCYSSTILDSTPTSVGSLFLPKLLQNVDLCGQQLDEMALKYNIVSFLPLTTNIDTGYGEKEP